MSNAAQPVADPLANPFHRRIALGTELRYLLDGITPPQRRLLRQILAQIHEDRCADLLWALALRSNIDTARAGLNEALNEPIQRQQEAGGAVESSDEESFHSPDAGSDGNDPDVDDVSSAGPPGKRPRT